MKPVEVIEDEGDYDQDDDGYLRTHSLRLAGWATYTFGVVTGWCPAFEVRYVFCEGYLEAGPALTMGMKMGFQSTKPLPRPIHRENWRRPKNGPSMTTMMVQTLRNAVNRHFPYETAGVQRAHNP